MNASIQEFLDQLMKRAGGTRTDTDGPVVMAIGLLSIADAIRDHAAAIREVHTVNATSKDLEK